MQMVTMEGLFASIISGLVFGGLYGLMALGLNVIFGVMRVVNVAHGDFIMLGMFATFWLFRLAGVDPFLSLIIVVPLFFVVGILMLKFLINPILKSDIDPKEKPLYALLITFGLGLLLRNMALSAWTGDFRAIYKYTDVPFPILPLSNGRIGAFLVATAMFLMVYLFFKKTYLGLSVLATIQDKVAAMLMGIDNDRVSMITFGLGIASAAAAGSLLSIVLAFCPDSGHPLTPKCFCMIVLGGMGSAVGSFLGGLMLGVIESISTQFVSTELTPAISLLALVAMLTIRPTGILGRMRE